MERERGIETAREEKVREKEIETAREKREKRR